MLCGYALLFASPVCRTFIAPCLGETDQSVYGDQPRPRQTTTGPEQGFTTALTGSHSCFLPWFTMVSLAQILPLRQQSEDVAIWGSLFLLHQDIPGRLFHQLVQGILPAQHYVIFPSHIWSVVADGLKYA